MKELILFLIFSICWSTIITRQIIGFKHLFINTLIVLVCNIIIVSISLIGLFTIVSKFNGNIMQPIKQSNYEIIHEPLYKKIK